MIDNVRVAARLSGPPTIRGVLCGTKASAPGRLAVAECAVIAVADAKWGEVGRAVVVTASDEPADEDDILGFLDGRLASYKVPKSVVFVDEIPRTASGKILKRPLRDRYGAP